MQQTCGFHIGWHFKKKKKHIFCIRNDSDRIALPQSSLVTCRFAKLATYIFLFISALLIILAQISAAPRQFAMTWKSQNRAFFHVKHMHRHSFCFYSFYQCIYME